MAGGASAGSAATDESTGAFTIDVALIANATNELSVTSLEGEISSPPTLVTVVHDDIAPTAPDSGRIAIGTPGGLGCTLRGATPVNGMTSAVEGNSSVRVMNMTGGGSSTSNANPDGSFNLSVPACAADILRLTATDAAGNVSEVTEMVVGS